MKAIQLLLLCLTLSTLMSACIVAARPGYYQPRYHHPHYHHPHPPYGHRW